MSDAQSWTTITLLADRLPLEGRSVLVIGLNETAEDERLEAAVRQAGAHVTALLVRHPAARSRAEAPFVEGCVDRLPFAAASFDLILLCQSLCHLAPADLKACLAAALVCLRPAGDLVLAGWPNDVLAYARHGLSGASIVESLDYLDAAAADQLEEKGTKRRLFAQFRRELPITREVAQVMDLPARRACLAIRRQVFVEEQGVPMTEEYETFDQVAPMLLARMDGEPAGTLRWRILSDGRAKVQRVAVTKHWRGHSVAREMMTALLTRLDTEGVPETVLGAQLQVQGFYSRFGYEPFGEVFLDAGISHISMARKRHAPHERQ